MSHPTTRHHSYTTSNTKIAIPAYETVLIEPPKRPHAKEQWVRTPRDSKVRSRSENVTAARYPAAKPSDVKNSSPKYFTTGKSWPYEEITATKEQHLKTDTADHVESTPSNLPKVPRGAFVQALCLPCDDPSLRLVNIPLTEVGPVRHHTTTEIRLGHIPNMKSLNDQGIFSWEFSQLVCLDYPTNDQDHSVDAIYFLYMSHMQESGLQTNELLEKYSEFHLYGDGFLFKVEGKSYNNGIANYLPMNKSSAVRDGKIRRDTAAILKELLKKLPMTNEKDAG